MAKPSAHPGLAAYMDHLPSGTPDGRARIHWAGSVRSRSLRRDGVPLPPPGVPRLGRVVDFYLPDGLRHREVFCLACWIRDADTFATLQGGGGTPPRVLALVEAEDDGAMEAAVRLAFDAWCRSGRFQAVTDSPMYWEPLPEADPPLDRFPCRYRWSDASQEWALDPLLADRTWGE